jgi:hypothetical protein
VITVLDVCCNIVFTQRLFICSMCFSQWTVIISVKGVDQIMQCFCGMRTTYFPYFEVKSFSVRSVSYQKDHLAAYLSVRSYFFRFICCPLCVKAINSSQNVLYNLLFRRISGFVRKYKLVTYNFIFLLFIAKETNDSCSEM